MGTMRYRSPEQLYGGIARYGPEEDMWALGCVMAELLTRGAPLFSADTEEGLLEQTIDLRDDIVTMEWRRSTAWWSCRSPGVSCLPACWTSTPGRGLPRQTHSNTAGSPMRTSKQSL